MEATLVEVDRLLRDLEDAPRRLALATAGLAAEALDRRTAAEPWSIGDILAHLRASADVRTKFIHVMLEGTPAPKYVSPRSSIKKTGYLSLAFHESFPTYTEQRSQLLAELRALRVEEWSLGATVQDRMQDVLAFTRNLVQHEIAHCAQVERLARLGS